MDGRTILYNHLAIHRRIQAAFIESGRHVFPISLMMIDIDDFKAINDSFGHPAGGSVLKTLAGVISGSAGNNDSAGRYGGDEFILSLLYCGKKEAMVIADRIRLKFLSERFADITALKPTISIGVAIQNGEIPGRKEIDLIHLVDLALYEVKKGGKDCIVFHVLE
ncbi:MAG: GGDEF domain-containing protein [Spirochaetales bacterium]|nr:GGDEF domain-containing protein [Spirochaetales bacterium]